MNHHTDMQYTLVLAGDAHIYVNDQPAPLNISELNSRAGYHHTVPIQLTLKPGDTNTIRFAAMGTSGRTMQLKWSILRVKLTSITDFEVYFDAIELHE
jgi:hypothetical protein